MDRINIKELKDWIAPYLTVNGNHIATDQSLKETNYLKYFVDLTLPNIFQKYAIILHSFWIYDLPKDNIKERNHKPSDVLSAELEDEENYFPISLTHFYKSKNIEFDLQKTVREYVERDYHFQQMNNEIYPGEGVLDENHIASVCENVIETYGNQEIEIYYIFLATKDWKEDLMYRGKISGLVEFIKNEETNLTPSLIYCSEKKWAINSDYDLPFSIIGGEEEFISKLIKDNPLEVYNIE